MGVPALGLFASDYVQAALGGGTTTRAMTALAVVLVAAAANARGVRVSGGVQVLLSGVLVVALLVVLAVSIPAARPERLTPFAPHGWGAIAPAALVLVWMLTGWEAVTHFTGRFRAPGGDVPRATAVTLVVVALLFGGITLALLTVLGADAAAGSAPVTALLAVRGGPAAAVIAGALALLVTLGNAYVAGLAELGGEMGHAGQAPRWLAGPATSTAPVRSLAVVTGQATAESHGRHRVRVVDGTPGPAHRRLAGGGLRRRARGRAAVAAAAEHRLVGRGCFAAAHPGFDSTQRLVPARGRRPRSRGAGLPPTHRRGQDPAVYRCVITGDATPRA